MPSDGCLRDSSNTKMAIIALILLVACSCYLSDRSTLGPIGFERLISETAAVPPHVETSSIN